MSAREARRNAQRPAGCVPGIISGQSAGEQSGHGPGIEGSPPRQSVHVPACRCTGWAQRVMG